MTGCVLFTSPAAAKNYPIVLVFAATFGSLQAGSSGGGGGGGGGGGFAASAAVSN